MYYVDKKLEIKFITKLHMGLWSLLPKNNSFSEIFLGALGYNLTFKGSE